MVKVLRRGKDPKTMPIRAYCFECGSELEFTRDEAELMEDQRDGDYYIIECPVCCGVVTIGKD